MDEEPNPDKIPMNPVQKVTSDNRLYDYPSTQPLSGRDQVMKGMFKTPKQKSVIPFKYQLLLGIMMLLFIIAAIFVGSVLFRNGLV